MKFFYTPVIISSFLFWGGEMFSQNIAINTSGAAANAAALIDIGTAAGGDTKGILIPRVALTALGTYLPVIPAGGVDGLLIYNTNNAVGNGVGYYYWSTALASWVNLIDTQAPTSGLFIQNQFAGAQTADHWVSGSSRATEVYAADWFRNDNVNTGLYNQTTGAGIYSPAAGLMSTYNNSALQITGASLAAGNLRFTDPNPYITASSYIQMPGGLYVSGGTHYDQNQYECRGGIHNDAAAYLEVDGGTGANFPTYIPNYVGIGTGNTAPADQLTITKNFRFPVTTSATVGVIMQGGNSFIHNYTVANPNLFIGQQAGNFTCTSSYNVGIGYQSMMTLTSGRINTAIGYHAEDQITSGQNNTAVGAVALEGVTSGGWNTCIGSNSGNSVTTGNKNCALGDAAYCGYQTGVNNTALGFAAMEYTSEVTGLPAPIAGGSDNTVVGYNALLAGSTCSQNTSLGSQTLPGNTTGSNNTAIGYHAGWGADRTNSTCFGWSSGGFFSAGNNDVEIGINTTAWIGGQVGWSTASDARIKDNVKENVPGLAFINLLRPVTYNFNVRKETDLMNLGKKELGEWEGKYDIEKIKFSGFLAQEVEKSAKEIGYDFSGVCTPATPDQLYSLRYSDFVVPLVKAVQELNAKNEAQQKTIGLLQQKVEAMEKLMDKK